MDNISIFIKIQPRLLKGHIKYITYIKTYTWMSLFEHNENVTPYR